jgi:hypothetical protein
MVQVIAAQVVSVQLKFSLQLLKPDQPGFVVKAESCRGQGVAAGVGTDSLVDLGLYFEHDQNNKLRLCDFQQTRLVLSYVTHFVT